MNLMSFDEEGEEKGSGEGNKVDEFRARSGRTPKKSRYNDWLQTEGTCILELDPCIHSKRARGSN